MDKPIILIGNGGHAKVLTEILLKQNRRIIGFTAPNLQANNFNIPYLGTDSKIESFSSENIELVLALGSVNVTNIRSYIFKKYKKKGYSFASVIHNSAIISSFSEMGEGVQIMAGSIIEAFSKISENTIVNTLSIINHDSIIGKHCHIAPGSNISGNVNIGDYSYIGSGATIIHNINIGENVLIGAGSVVLKSIKSNGKAYGVPAKEV
ncbi:acetyltransferase [Exiguobacterium undae]